MFWASETLTNSEVNRLASHKETEVVHFIFTFYFKSDGLNGYVSLDNDLQSVWELRLVGRRSSLGITYMSYHRGR